jgi:hypothetical protein
MGWSTTAEKCLVFPGLQSSFQGWNLVERPYTLTGQSTVEILGIGTAEYLKLGRGIRYRSRQDSPILVRLSLQICNLVEFLNGQARSLDTSRKDARCSEVGCEMKIETLLDTSLRDNQLESEFGIGTMLRDICL